MSGGSPKVIDLYAQNRTIIRTMTLNELTERLRKHGIAIASETVGDAIEQGVFPFANCIKRKTRVFLIFEKMLENWIAERAGYA